MHTVKASKIHLFQCNNPPMRAFHMSWIAFFFCFFAWFGVAPLMSVIRQEMGLTTAQVADTWIASVFIAIFARFLMGWLCDKFGPRLCYTWLLIVSAIPVIGIGFAQDYYSFLFFRLCIGILGASFVITQYHCSMMFAGNCIGTANALSAGFGNFGGGVAQMMMPLFFSMFVFFGASQSLGWRLAIMVPGGFLLILGALYYFFTQDTPKGNFDQILITHSHSNKLPFREALKDYRVWILALIYGACFGVGLTITNMASLYFTDFFHLNIKHAGLAAGIFGVLSISRILGGYLGDHSGKKWGLRGRVLFLALFLAIEAITLILFSRSHTLFFALLILGLFAICSHMSSGLVFSITPFINKKILGAITGIVSAGGNLGAVLAGFLFKTDKITWANSIAILGLTVALISILALFIKFSAEDEVAAKHEAEKMTV
jgi:NNP family nitrate/nitrite transporter-like MFS transporter